MPRITGFLAFQALLAMSMLATPARAQQRAVLRGTVLREADDGPVAGSEVSIPSLSLSATTDSTGKFRLANVPAGAQIVWVRRVGFEKISTVLTFVAGDTLERDFSLVSVATKLPEVDVKAVKPATTAKLSEFEDRRKLGFGHFLTEDDLLKAQGRRLPEIMALVPGPWVFRGHAGGKAWLVGGRGQVSFLRNGPAKLDASDAKAGAQVNLCYSAVVLDGAFVYQGQDGETLFDLNSIEPSSISGIEVYTSTATIPAKYNGTRSTCGLVIIWTKT